MDSGLFFALDGPLHALPAAHQMRAANLRGFLALAQQRGAEPAEILAKHGLDARAVSDPDHYILCQAVVDVLEECSMQFNDPLFGLQLAKLQDPYVYGCATALCRSAPTLRSALDIMVEYLPITHSPESVLELVEGGDIAELRWDSRSDLGVNDQAHYQAMLLNLKLLELLVPRFAANYVNIRVDGRDRDLPAIEAAANCPVHIRAAGNAIGFPRQLLDQPVATSDRLLFRLVGSYLEKVKAAARGTLVERVEDYVRGALPSGSCSVDRCAKMLGTSARTLQSRLAAHDIRFSDIVEQQRVELSKDLLRRGELSLDDLAVRLGYSEQTAFGRAFKRWTGMTPQRFRSVQAGRAARMP